MSAATEDEGGFTADAVFDMLVESSDVVQVPYTVGEKGEIVVAGDVQVVKDAGERDDKVASLLQHEEVARQASVSSTSGRKAVREPELASEAVTDVALFELARRLVDGVRAADVRTAQLFKHAVVAQHLVDWLAQNAGKGKFGDPVLLCPRPVALALAQRMAAQGYLVPAEQGTRGAPAAAAPATFADDTTVYRYLIDALQDDDCADAVLHRIHDALAAESGGITTHTEKIMLKTVKAVVHEADLATWLQAKVPGAKAASTAAVVRVLLKHGILEHVKLIGAVATAGSYTLAARKQVAL